MHDLLAYKGIAIGLWLVIFFAGERLKPAVPFPAGFGLSGARLWRNAGLAAINFALSPLIVLPLTTFAAGHGLAWRPDWWRGAAGLALDLLLLDALIYWWHRWNHELDFLWRFHGVHHLDRFLDSTSALRFHFGEVLLSALARASVVVLVGFPLSSILVFETLVLIAAIFHHSDLRLPGWLEVPLSRLIITPSIHWVHHHRRRVDTDSNYGTIFSFWDRLFASRSPTRRRADMAIGVEGEDEGDFLALLMRPLRGRGGS